MPLALCRPSTPAVAPPAPLPAGCSEELWRPRAPALVPSGLPSLRFATYTLMHYAGRFGNDEYGVYLIRCEGRVVHYSCVNPRDFRYPFMSVADLQVGDVATAESHRGLGLASHAIARIVSLHAAPGRTFWYISDEENRPSIAAAEKAGFTPCGRVLKYPRFGLPFLGSYEYTPF